MQKSPDFVGLQNPAILSADKIGRFCCSSDIPFSCPLMVVVQLLMLIFNIINTGYIIDIGGIRIYCVLMIVIMPISFITISCSSMSEIAVSSFSGNFCYMADKIWK